MKDIFAQQKAVARREADRISGVHMISKQLVTLQNKIDMLERQNRMILRHILLPDEAAWQGLPQLQLDSGPGDFIFSRAELCRAESFQAPYFSYWVRALGEALRYHRKLWEFVFVCQVLHERGQLEPGKRGLGFGVGAEPLSAYFASRGCEILGTDMAAEAAIAAGWTQTAQHAAGKQALARPALCAADAFERQVHFRTVDMNAIPDDLVDFDFCWSACALEHLGSIDKGLEFIERSVETLKPGGYAVHTTEFNVSSDTETLADGGTVLFRKQDMEALTARLEALGHEVTPFDFHPGYGEVDRYIDVAPYLEQPHLKMELAGYVTTSIGIIVRRGAQA